MAGNLQKVSCSLKELFCRHLIILGLLSIKMVKSKDAAKPKNKMSAYQFFMVELKEEKKAKNPGEPLKLADLSKDVSEKWKVLSNIFINLMLNLTFCFF